MLIFIRFPFVFCFAYLNNVIFFCIIWFINLLFSFTVLAPVMWIRNHCISGSTKFYEYRSGSTVCPRSSDPFYLLSYYGSLPPGHTVKNIISGQKKIFVTLCYSPLVYTSGSVTETQTIKMSFCVRLIFFYWTQIPQTGLLSIYNLVIHQPSIHPWLHWFIKLFIHLSIHSFIPNFTQALT